MNPWRTLSAIISVAVVAMAALAVPPAATAADRDLVVNGGFETGHEPWWNTGNFSFSTGEGAYCSTVPAGLQQWEAIVGQHGLDIADETPYVLRFDAWSTTTATIRAQVQPKSNPSLITYGRMDAALDTQRRSFELPFTPSEGSANTESSIQFRLGGNAATTICIDDVSLVTPEAEPEPAGPDELLANTSFDSTHKPWWANGGMKLDISSGELCVDPRSSANLWDLLVGQNSVYLPGSTRFTLSFDARASIPVTSGVQVAPFYNPENTTFLAKTFTLGTAPSHHSFAFETTFTDAVVMSAVQFRVGGASTAHTVCFDNVSLRGTAYDYVADTGSSVKVNQVGYLTHGPKNATVVTEASEPLPWQLLHDGERVASGSTTPAGFDDSAGAAVHTVDFSEVTRSGDAYTLEVDGRSSSPFRIGDDVFQALRSDSLRFFYTNRSGIAIDGAIAGEQYARPAGHLGIAPNQGDREVGCQAPQPYMDDWTCDYALDVTGGWYDAGDHGKYVVNGGIATSQLLSAWERAQQAGTEQELGDSTLAVPERGNAVPDILDEARWSLDFLLKMQVPQGRPLAGMAHHKVQDESWTGLPLLPSADSKPRQLHRPSTAATLNLAAVAAQGSRVFAEFDGAYSARLLTAAQRAYDAALAHPALLAPREDGENGGGAYADDDVTDEFYWAAAELYLTTHGTRFAEDLEKSPLHRADVFAPEGFYWGSVAALGRMQLARFADDLEDISRIRRSVVEAADDLVARQDDEPFGQPYSPDDGRYVWGSNSSILNNQVVIATAYDLTGRPGYARAVVEGYDYLMGRNVLGQSYITGWGENDAHDQHSRWYAHSLDPALPNPPVGSVAGGPNSDLQDPISSIWLAGCAPQACYVDNIEAWAVNEITINWNSALAWVASFVADLGDGSATQEPAPCTDDCAPQTAQLTLSPAQAVAGGEVEVGLSGFAPSQSVQLWLHSGPVRVGTVTVGADGSATVTIRVPAATAVGAHTLVATDDGDAELARTPLQVIAPGTAPGDPDDGGADDGGVDDGADGDLATTGIEGALWTALGLLALACVAAGLVLRFRFRSARPGDGGE
ncbi:glycoside hydrolase family 9 protein [Microbacterium sp. NPDC058342]|uniref:glycoside hydrolase family 9 protein n=1 Tax=Microbacterium sp. NPDC058342 TaxID=3346454 RepID=UPI003663DAC4